MPVSERAGTSPEAGLRHWEALDPSDMNHLKGPVAVPDFPPFEACDKRFKTQAGGRKTHRLPEWDCPHYRTLPCSNGPLCHLGT